MILGIRILWLTKDCFRHNLKNSTRTIFSLPSSSTIIKTINYQPNYPIKWRKWQKFGNNSLETICYRTIYQSSKSESNKNTALLLTSFVIIVLGRIFFN